MCTETVLSPFPSVVINVLYPMRILILRPDDIGDCVLFSGFLQHFRTKWPTAHIDLMVQPHIRNLFERCPHVDRILSIDRLLPWKWMQRRGLRGAWKVETMSHGRLFARLWYPSYGVVIYPVSAPVEDMLAAVRRIKAPQKWGCGGFMFRQKQFKDEANRPEQALTRCHTLREADHWIPELPRTTAILKGLGIESQDAWPEFWLSKDDEEQADRLLPKEQVLGIFPGAASKWRLWPVKKWHTFLATQRVSRQIAIVGGPKEQELARQIMTLPGGSGLQFTDLTGKTSLRQMVACIKRCTAMVSMETSGLHIAVACRVPTVGLTGGHHYGRYYPWGDARINRVACVEKGCFRCNRECDYGDYRCVANITVDRVLEELDLAVENNREKKGAARESSGREDC